MEPAVVVWQPEIAAAGAGWGLSSAETAGAAGSQVGLLPSARCTYGLKPTIQAQHTKAGSHT